MRTLNTRLEALETRAGGKGPIREVVVCLPVFGDDDWMAQDPPAVQDHTDQNGRRTRTRVELVRVFGTPGPGKE